MNSNQMNSNQMNSNQMNPNQMNPNQMNPNQMNGYQMNDRDAMRRGALRCEVKSMRRRGLKEVPFDIGSTLTLCDDRTGRWYRTEPDRLGNVWTFHR